MNKDEIKERIGKIDNRIKVLWRDYPLVTVAVFLAGGAVTEIAHTLWRWLS